MSARERFGQTPRRVDKPWGWELVWAETDDYVGKLLFVRAGEALSLQYHEVKDESWLVQEGRAVLEWLLEEWRNINEALEQLSESPKAVARRKA